LLDAALLFFLHHKDERERADDLAGELAASMAYYEGAGAVLSMWQSKEPAIRSLYDRLGRWVTERQKAAIRASR